MIIVAKLSFWIMKSKPTKTSIITWLSLQKTQPFEDLILDALAQFRKGGYVEKLKTNITPESLPESDKKKLLEFLCNQIA